MANIGQVIRDIQSLKIQGATNIALAVLDGLTQTIIDCPKCSSGKLLEVGRSLASARPNEPLAQNAFRFIFAEKNALPAHYQQRIREYRELIAAAKAKIAAAGLGLIKNGGTYLTHCHASTVTQVFLAAKKQGKQFAVIATETRPLFQGKLTVQELLAGGISDVTMVIDTVAVSILAGAKRRIDAVIIGADLLSAEGFVNKVGSLALVKAACERSIPVYCFSTLLKFDPQPFTKDLIEQRSSEEIWPGAPRKLKFYAPAFDYIPYSSRPPKPPSASWRRRANLKIICEAGIIDGREVKNQALALYPFLSGGKTHG